jgi:hypothetical protein
MIYLTSIVVSTLTSIFVIHGVYSGWTIWSTSLRSTSSMEQVSLALQVSVNRMFWFCCYLYCHVRCWSVLSPASINKFSVRFGSVYTESSQGNTRSSLLWMGSSCFYCIFLADLLAALSNSTADRTNILCTLSRVD